MLLPVEVVGVRIEMPSNQPIALLKEVSGSRFLPIWVGTVEATAIAFAQQSLSPTRPLTHDLLAQTIETLEASLEAVHITELKEGIFFAELHFGSKGGSKVLSCRPSDAIALALRSGAPVLVESELLDSAGIDIPEQSIDGASGAPGEGSTQELEKFREFLDQINPEDFGT